jgi:antitoxin VapB
LNSTHADVAMLDRGLCISIIVLHIRDPEADRLARELATRTGQPITRVVVEALRDKLKRDQRRTAFPRLKDEIMAISRRTAALPRRTGRSAHEILGYDEGGLPR